MKLECNVGEKDSKLRLAAGFALVVGGLLAKGGLLVIIGLVLMFTGWKRSCMLYSLLKVNTNKDGGTPPTA